MSISLATGDPANWTVSDLGSKQPLIRNLNEEELAAFDAVLAAARQPGQLDEGPPVALPALDQLARDVREALSHGRGVIVLSGLDVGRLGEGGFRQCYWDLGKRIGTPAVQSERLEKIGFVRHEKDNPFGRGYITDIELVPHTDVHDILSLASLSTASRGGESGFVSAVAVHDVMARECPDLLAALYEGFPSGIPANYGVPNAEVGGTDDKVPVYCNVGGTVSVFVHGHYMLSASRASGVPIPERLVEAMEKMTEISRRKDLLLEFLLEPGEIAFFNNRAVMHARRAFENEPGRERVLLRLWLHAPDIRPLDPQIARQPVMMDAVHELVAARLAA